MGKGNSNRRNHTDKGLRNYIQQEVNNGRHERNILASVKKEFYIKDENPKEFKKKVLKIIRSFKKEVAYKNRPKPKNEVIDIKYCDQQISEAMDKSTQLFNANCYNITNASQNITSYILEDLFINNKFAILDLPCASGKTTSAIILAATYAKPNERIWIVTEKINDAIRIKNYLLHLNVRATAWHGYSSELCSLKYNEFIKKNPKDNCKACQSKCSAFTKYTASCKWDDNESEVLVTTHAHWQSAVYAKKIPESVKYVIVDESPELMEYYQLGQSDINVLRQVFANKPEHLQTFNTDIEFIVQTVNFKGCYKIPRPVIINYHRKIFDYAYDLYIENKLNSESFSKVCAFLEFFAYRKQTEIYGMLESPSDKTEKNNAISFIRGMVELETNIPHLILDGSARMSDVTWNNFKIYSCSALKQQYVNTTVNFINSNPSKSRLSNDKVFAELENSILRSISNLNTYNNLLLFRNKDLKNNPKLLTKITNLETKLKNKNINLTVMNRGQHKGSNTGRQCTVNAICMSLFRPIQYYVLRAALRNKKEINSKQIWTYKKSIFHPNMKKGGGFSDKLIHETYCRTIVIDLYQTIMRGCIRDNPNANYQVFTLLSGIDIIRILEGELPGAQFIYDNSEIIKEYYSGTPTTEIVNNLDVDITERNKYKMVQKIISTYQNASRL